MTVFGDGVPNEGLTPVINRKEVEVALKGMTHGKAMGPDEIQVETWKSSGEVGVDMLLHLLQKIFEQEKIPEARKDIMIVPIFNENGDIQDYGNYRGIKMIYHTTKIWERIIDRILEGGDKHRRRAVRFHAGHRDNRCHICSEAGDRETPEMQKVLHNVFIHLEKAGCS